MVMLFVFLSIEDDARHVITYLNILISIAAILKFSSCSSSSIFPFAILQLLLRAVIESVTFIIVCISIDYNLPRLLSFLCRRSQISNNPVKH